jgi:hypothetical protein
MAWPGTCERNTPNRARSRHSSASWPVRFPSIAPIARKRSVLFKTFSFVQNVQSPCFLVSVSPCVPQPSGKNGRKLAHRLTNYCFLLFVETLPLNYRPRNRPVPASPCLRVSVSPCLPVSPSPLRRVSHAAHARRRVRLPHRQRRPRPAPLGNHHQHRLRFLTRGHRSPFPRHAKGVRFSPPGKAKRTLRRRGETERILTTDVPAHRIYCDHGTGGSNRAHSCIRDRT